MKKFLKQFALGLFVFIILNTIIAVTYEYPTYKSVKNKTNRNYLKWEALHQNENTFDLIIIGTSRAYASFNPMLIDSVLNTNSYNMSTSAQDIAETYYSLEEIFDYQKPKYIVLDLFLQASDASYDYYQTFSNASFFNSDKRKFNLIYKGYGTTGILNYSIPIVKFKNYIKQDMVGLFSNNKSLRKEDTWFKGYLYDTLTVSKAQISNFEPISNFENTTFNKNRFDSYMKKIMSLVKDNNSQLICVRAPYPPSRFKLNDNDDENTYFQSYMKKVNIPFYDLNSFKNYKYQDQDFADYHHPNYKGAKKASQQLIEILKKS
ncbi:hypothetical protein ADIWIN_3985 [Winogradskyella psychrotolerans RS-3]|uniref:SGNH/GDSL hydrolase family protein n=1 Tax=Winogradskyella psychrotolerans RS-3 TaxID=641526 RepID=S7VHQ3_9FLAO|nr:SGNH/GDSL hydrolase family protein [Winogradskyella psychrotolerans]EPR69710.1 hypothetical protein ADIWIN_3985 [Winogradskyella psychrotolerans RS-3]